MVSPWGFSFSSLATGAPVAKLENEKPQGETIDYDTLIKSWN